MRMVKIVQKPELYIYAEGRIDAWIGSGITAMERETFLKLARRPIALDPSDLCFVAKVSSNGV